MLSNTSACTAKHTGGAVGDETESNTGHQHENKKRGTKTDNNYFNR